MKAITSFGYVNMIGMESFIDQIPTHFIGDDMKEGDSVGYVQVESSVTTELSKIVGEIKPVFSELVKKTIFYNAAKNCLKNLVAEPIEVSGVFRELIEQFALNHAIEFGEDTCVVPIANKTLLVANPKDLMIYCNDDVMTIVAIYPRKVKTYKVVSLK